MLSAINISPKVAHTATVIFLHGLGDSGSGWSDVGRMFATAFPHIKWIFPNAPSLRITVNQGALMPGWYDIVSLERIAAAQDKKGMLKSCEEINKFIDHEISNGINSKRIILGGFSQGAAMSLLTGLTTQKQLGGIVALSGYLPLGEEIDGMR